MRAFYRKRLHFVESGSDAGRYRYLANPNPRAEGTPTGWNRQTTSIRRTYYLSSPGDPYGTVTRGYGNRLSGWRGSGYLPSHIARRRWIVVRSRVW